MVFGALINRAMGPSRSNGFDAVPRTGTTDERRRARTQHAAVLVDLSCTTAGIETFDRRFSQRPRFRSWSSVVLREDIAKLAYAWSAGLIREGPRRQLLCEALVDVDARKRRRCSRKGRAQVTLKSIGDAVMTPTSAAM